MEGIIIVSCRDPNSSPVEFEQRKKISTCYFAIFIYQHDCTSGFILYQPVMSSDQELSNLRVSAAIAATAEVGMTLNYCFFGTRNV